jgi:hypothetical protein
MNLTQTINIEVYPTDLGGVYTQDEAIAACAALGDGWRLPSRQELLLLWGNKKDIGEFVGCAYWSLSEANAYNAWYQDFYLGNQTNYSKCHYLRVRAVRDAKQEGKP